MRAQAGVLALVVGLSGCPDDPSNGPEDSDSAVDTEGIGDTEDPTETEVPAETDEAPVAPTCADWCAAVTATCTGDDAQFPSEAACLGFCAGSGLAAGTVEDASANTLGCRVHHAALAAAGDVTARAEHCPYAGAFGGGRCGALAESFCAVNLHVCTGDDAAYATLADCTTATAGLEQGTPDDPTGDTLSCRVYHLGVAVGMPAPHCAATAADGGGVCVDPSE